MCHYCGYSVPYTKKCSNCNNDTLKFVGAGTQKLEEELKILLIPKDPDDDRNIICEIRGGAGGEEAALFAGTLFRMYSMYAEKKHWKLEILNETIMKAPSMIDVTIKDGLNTMMNLFNGK